MLQNTCEGGLRKNLRNSPTDFKVSGEGGSEVFSARAEVLLLTMEETMVGQLCPCSPWRVWGSRDQCCTHGGTHTEDAEGPRKGTAAHGESTPEGLLPVEGSPHWSRFWWQDCDLWGTHWRKLFPADWPRGKGTAGEVVKICILWQGPTLEQLMEVCIPQEGHAAAAEKWGGRRSMKEPLWTDPSPYSSYPFLEAEGSRSVDAEGEHLSLERSWGGLSGFVFVSHHATLFLIGK